MKSNLITAAELGELKPQFDGFKATAMYMRKHFFSKAGYYCNWVQEFDYAAMKLYFTPNAVAKRQFYYTLTEFNEPEK